MPAPNLHHNLHFAMTRRAQRGETSRHKCNYKFANWQKQSDQ